MSVQRWTAPGRVNLIGEHLDYNGGPVLPIAIDRSTTVKARTREDDRVRVWSAGRDASVEFAVASAPGDVQGWAGYVAGVVWACRQSGLDVPGVDVVVDSDVPVGAGLSSSAALECAVALAVVDLVGVDLDPIDLALIGQRAENDYVGVPCGSMDQLASACGRQGTLCSSTQLPSAPPSRPSPHTGSRTASPWWSSTPAPSTPSPTASTPTAAVSARRLPGCSGSTLWPRQARTRSCGSRTRRSRHASAT
ncbi:MAG: galactokinase family protein [Nocardioidaceae bacterium]